MQTLSVKSMQKIKSVVNYHFINEIIKMKCTYMIQKSAIILYDNEIARRYHKANST